MSTESGTTDCLFCRIVDGQLPSDTVYQDDELLAFKDISPQAPTHIQIIPKRHVATLNELTDADGALVGRMHLRAQALAREHGIADSGYRLIMNCNDDGGQTIYHIHLHLLGGRPLRALG